MSVRLSVAAKTLFNTSQLCLTEALCVSRTFAGVNPFLKGLTTINIIINIGFSVREYPLIADYYSPSIKRSSYLQLLNRGSVNFHILQELLQAIIQQYKPLCNTCQFKDLQLYDGSRSHYMTTTSNVVRWLQEPLYDNNIVVRWLLGPLYDNY